MYILCILLRLQVVCICKVSDDKHTSMIVGGPWRPRTIGCMPVLQALRIWLGPSEDAIGGLEGEAVEVVEVEERPSPRVVTFPSSLEYPPGAPILVELGSLSSRSASKSLMVLVASFSSSLDFGSSNGRMDCVVFW